MLTPWASSHIFPLFLALLLHVSSTQQNFKKLECNWYTFFQIKLASVKLAMKYMKRVSAELESVCGGPEEEELIVQGVRFAFRVHQVKTYL